MSQGTRHLARPAAWLSAASVRPARVGFAATLGLLLAGLVPLPAGWTGARSAVEHARSSDLSRAPSDPGVPGYYEGLIGGGTATARGARSELSLRLLGKPAQWTRDNARDITRHLTGDFLQFELVPNQDKVFLDRPFRTNPQGQRDHPYTVAKPPGTFRIAVLGSSMDMGWGVTNEETYVNLLEGWLNEHAARRGVDRRFEVVNFAVAAYAPLQRLESYRRKARLYEPDMVIYSATLLDLRLTEIHLCDIYADDVRDLRYGFLRRIVAESGLAGDDLRRGGDGRLVTKEPIKRKLRPRYWSIYDGVLGTLAADCRSEGRPLACVMVPRVGRVDAPEARAEMVARLQGIAAHHAIPLFDLTGTFDHVDPSQLEIAAWDDHPNAQGHRRLFLALARYLVQDRTLYDTLFPAP
jgi:hypothetical protein